MPRRGAFENCHSTYGTLDLNDPNKNKVSFYAFPEDEERRKLWIKKCNRKDDFHVANAVICFLHFEKADYE